MYSCCLLSATDAALYVVSLWMASVIFVGADMVMCLRVTL